MTNHLFAFLAVLKAPPRKTRKFLLMWHCSARRLAGRGRKQQKSSRRHKKSNKFAFNQIRLLCFAKKAENSDGKKIFISNSNAWKITFLPSPFGRDNFYYWKHQNTRTNNFGSSSLVKVSRNCCETEDILDEYVMQKLSSSSFETYTLPNELFWWQAKAPSAITA